MAKGVLTVKIAGDDSQLKKTLAGVNTHIGGLGRSFSGFGRAMGLGIAGGAAVATAAITAFAAVGVKSLGRIERINTQTATVIKSTGAAAGVSAKQIEDLAGSLENTTTVEAETIQQGENLLLTFTNIQNKAGKGNDIFTQATKVMTDMSVALGQDMNSSAIQLGKALNDPIKGVTALQRVGVSFTADQKKQITTLVKTGQTMKAQKLILAELNKEFGGSGAAQASTYEGKMKLLGHAFGTLQETIMTAAMPYLMKFADWLRGGVGKVQGFIDKLEALRGWKGADLSTKIKMSWEFLKTSLTGWLDNGGREKIAAAFKTLGSVAAQIIAGIFGASSAMGETAGVFGQMGGAAADGFREGFSSVMAQYGGFHGLIMAALYNSKVPTGLEKKLAELVFGKDTVATYIANQTGAVRESAKTIGLAIHDPISGKIKTLPPEIVKSVAAATGGTQIKATALGGTLQKGMATGYAGLPGSISATVGQANQYMPAQGSAGGSAYGTGFTDAAKQVIGDWANSSGIGAERFWGATGGNSGSGFGADILSELRIQYGSGLTAHTAQMAGVIGSLYGSSVISGYRPGATIRDTGRPSLHASGRGLDFSGGNLWGAFHYATQYAQSIGLQEALYKDQAWSRGLPFEHWNSNAQSRADHQDHLHLGFLYDQGGYLKPGVSVVENRTGKPEPVLTSEQWSALSAQAGPPVVVNVTVQGSVLSERDLVNAIRRQVKLHGRGVLGTA